MRALRMWSRLVQAASIIVIGLSALLMLAPSLGESLFYLVYFRQAASPLPVPDQLQGYIRFANGIIETVMVGWMVAIIILARVRFVHGERYAWQAIAWPVLG